MTGSVTDLGIVTAAQTAALLVFVLLGGVWADRLPRQRMMLVSDPVRMAAQGLCALGVSGTLYGATGLFVILPLTVLSVPAVRNFGAGGAVAAPAAGDQSP